MVSSNPTRRNYSSKVHLQGRRTSLNMTTTTLTFPRVLSRGFLTSRISRPVVDRLISMTPSESTTVAGTQPIGRREAAPEYCINLKML